MPCSIFQSYIRRYLKSPGHFGVIGCYSGFLSFNPEGISEKQIETLIEYQELVYLIKKMTMAKNTSILLGEHFENFVNEKISSGKFSSVSEVIRTALRLLEKEENQHKALINELEIGERSKFIKNFDRDANLKDLHAKHLKNEVQNK